MQFTLLQNECNKGAVVHNAIVTFRVLDVVTEIRELTCARLHPPIV